MLEVIHLMTKLAESGRAMEWHRNETNLSCLALMRSAKREKDGTAQAPASALALAIAGELLSSDRAEWDAARNRFNTFS